LWYWSYQEAWKSKIFDLIIISSDGGITKGKVLEPAFIDNDRPEMFATDEANLDDLLFFYASKNKDIELWCLLQPTSPLRTAQDIKKAHKIVLNEKWDSLVSVTPNPVMGWVENATSEGHVALYHYNERPNRQKRKSWFLENGAIYFTKKYVLDTFRSRLGGQIALYKMPKERSIEIDDEFDWKIAEYLMNGRK